MLKLIAEIQELHEAKSLNESVMIMESADKYLGQIYVKIGNKHRTLKQQDINVQDLAKILSGFRVLGKSSMRAGFADVSSPKVLLRMLNDIAEAGQEKVFGEDDGHRVIADERIKQIGETAHNFVEQYEMLLNNLEQDNEDEESRETLLRDINKMRTFFEQARNKLKTHLAQQTVKPAQDGLGNAAM